MQLRKLIEVLPRAAIAGSLNRDVTGLAHDSRQVTPGMVYFALPSRVRDGHHYIVAALERGATAVVHERNGFLPRRATTIRVHDARLALARVAAAFFEHPSRKLTVIGVTGASGKTTVTFITRQLLAAAGLKTGLISSVQTEVGERVIPAQRTLPEALETHQMLAAMVRAGCRVGVLAITPEALAQHQVDEVEFDFAVFTNYLGHGRGPDRLGPAGSRLAQPFLTARPDGTKLRGAVINCDDAVGLRLLRETQAHTLLTYGFDPLAQVRASEMRPDGGGTRVRINLPEATFICRLPLLGRHNVSNVLAAVGVGSILGLRPAVIKHALEHLEPVPGRLELVDAGQPFGVFVDYARAETGLRHALTTLRSITPRRLLLGFGCSGERDAALRARLGKLAAQLADHTIITTDNPRREAPATIAAQVLEGYCAVRAEGCRVELDRRRAIEDLVRMASPGDTILIAGKGHETYQEFADTIVPFDDRVHAREALETLGFHPPADRWAA